MNSEENTYEEAISARYAFSFAINGSVLGNVACALAKWENFATPVDPMMFEWKGGYVFAFGLQSM